MSGYLSSEGDNHNKEGSLEKENLSKYTDLDHENRLTSILNNLTRKHSNSKTNLKDKWRVDKHTNTVSSMHQNNLLSQQEILLGSAYSRLGRLKNAEKEFYEIKNKKREIKNKKVIKQEKNNNRYQIILKQIYNLYEISDNKSQLNINFKESILNSIKNFKESHIIKKEEAILDKSKNLKNNNKKYFGYSDESDDYSNKSLSNLFGSRNWKTNTNKEKFFSTELSNIQKSNNFQVLSRELTKINEENDLLDFKRGHIDKGSSRSNSKIRGVSNQNQKYLPYNSNKKKNNKNSLFVDDIYKKTGKKSLSPGLIKRNLHNIQEIVLKAKNINEYRNGEIINNLILPKLHIRDLNVESLPQHIDIYKKLKIKDIISFSKFAKPPFK